YRDYTPCADGKGAAGYQENTFSHEIKFIIMRRGIWPVRVIPNIGGIFSVIAGSVPSVTTDFIGDFYVVR
ncbi:MAG TPA: hypothetical protein ACFYEL_09935, partial [Candidatus Wunengus californicus]|uniref:hypothetical protein n=1 Tax=Candidatus Wunengus californicus TaxID=3367619 RepID=UPI0040283C90